MFLSTERNGKDKIPCSSKPLISSLPCGRCSPFLTSLYVMSFQRIDHNCQCFQRSRTLSIRTCGPCDETFQWIFYTANFRHLVLSWDSISIHYSILYSRLSLHFKIAQSYMWNDCVRNKLLYNKLVFYTYCRYIRTRVLLFFKTCSYILMTWKQTVVPASTMLRNY